MTLASGPFNTQSWDANDLSGYFASLVGNGVFPNPANNLQVVTHENMQTKIKSGIGWINGKIIRNPTDLILTHDIADGVLKRIDRVVMRVNYVTNNAEFAIKKGAFASNPTAPALTRNADMYELALADVYVANGATRITNANITDQRANSSLCGIVKGLIDQIDTTDLFNQYNDAFQTWFTHLQNELNENQAANLQNQIDGVTSQLADKAKYTVFTKSNNQTIPNAAVTNLLWEQMTPHNDADFCILEGNRIKFTQSGLYQIQLSLTWELNAPNNFIVFPTKNPSIGPQWLGGDNYSFLTAFAEYNAGEYLNDRVYQTSGSAKNIITNVRSMVEIRQVVRL